MSMDRLIRLFRLHAAFWLAIAVLAAVAALAPIDGGWSMRLAAGWDAGVGAFLLLTFSHLFRARTLADIRRRAAELDETGAAVLPLSLAAALASIVVVILVMAGGGKPSMTEAVFSIVTVALSWLFTHLIFALHYAHEFYAPHETGEGDRGGLIFPGEHHADYWDFLHFGLVIGVANQTADIQISSRKLRRIATVHCLVAWLFNAVILALTVNLAATLLQ
jgi:uncharacterized membrane protein